MRWDGTHRIASLEDLQKKHKLIPSNELIRLLQSSMTPINNANTNTNSTANNNHLSLLYQPKRIQIDRDLIEEMKSIQSRLVDLTLQIHSNSRQISTNQKKIEHQQSQDSEPLQPLLLTTAHLNPNHDSFLANEDVLETLKSIGRLKNSKLLEDHIRAKTEENEKLLREKASLSTFLATKHADHFLVGEITNGVDWLRSRSLGPRKFGPLTSASFNLPRGVSEEGTVILNPHPTVESLVLNQYQLLWSSSGHLLHPAYCSVFDRTGRYLITGADDYLVKIWDTETGQLVKTCRGHGGHVTVITVSFDNSLLATSCTTGSIRLWRLSDAKCLCIMQHETVVNWLQFDQLTGALVSAGDDGQCIVWDLSCYIPFDETDCWTNPADYEEGGKRWWVGDMSVRSVPTLRNCLETANSISGRSNTSAPAQLQSGLFPWNRDRLDGSLICGCLSLPHFKDGLSGEAIKIFTFDICPKENIIATGCEDGIARLWRFNDISQSVGTSGDNTNTQMILNSRTAENLLKLQKMKEILSPVDYGKLEKTSLYLLARLEGHMDEVTDLKFSNCGDRLCSGSMKDGTVRIWAFSKDYLKNDLIILNMNDHIQGDEEEPRVEAGRSYRPQQSHRMNQSINYKSEIYNIGWSCNDQMIFVVHSKVPKKLTRTSISIPTKLSVFSSLTGNLLNSFRISKSKSHVLATHPHNPSIIFTGGEDGFMNVWNVERAVLISQYQLLSPPNIEEIMPSQLPVDILDAMFSPDGYRIAITDSIGRAVVLGRDDPARFSGVYPEQYFSTDYAVVVHDHFGWPIDEGTQLPLHSAPVGPLVDINHKQYSNQPRFEYFSLPLPLSYKLICETRKEILESRSHWNRTIHQAYLSLKKFKNYHPTNSSDSKSSANKKPPVWGNKPLFSRSSPNIQSLSTTSRDTDRRRYIVISDDDESYPLDLDADSDAVDAPGNNYFSDSEESLYDNRHPNRRSQRRRLAVSDGGRRLGTRRRGMTSSRYSPPPPPFHNERVRESGNRSRATRATVRRISREAEEDIMESGDHDGSSTDCPDVNMSGESDPEIKPRSRRQNSVEEIQNQTLSRIYSGWLTLRTKGKYRRIIPIGTEIEREWLLSDSPSDYHYCPQVGDQVMYFPQGHLNHLNLIPEQKRPPWMSFPLKWPVVECQIVSISHDFPTHSEFNKCPSVIAKIQLQLTGRPLRWGSNCRSGQIYSSFGSLRESRHTTPPNLQFEVSLRSSSLPDYIIPSYLYYRCSVVNWQPSVEFVSYFLEYQEDDQSKVYKDYAGVVGRVTDSDSQDWPHSPWESLEIQWKDSSTQGGQQLSQGDGSDYERISPWDAIIPNSTYPSKHFYPATLPTELRERVLEMIQGLMLEEDYQPFAYPVDPEIFPDYDCTIPVPMYLDLMRRRLENNFYHQVPPTSDVFSYPPPPPS